MTQTVLPAENAELTANSENQSKFHVPKLVRVLEILLRLIIVFAVPLLLDRIFWWDVVYFWYVHQQFGAGRLPYAQYLWEFPPLTLIPTLIAPLLPQGAFIFVFALMMATLEYSTLEILRRSRPAQAVKIAIFWHLFLILLAPIAYFRLDFIPVFFAAIVIVRWQAGENSFWAIILGFAAKLWPAVLIIGVLIKRRFRDALYAVCGMAGVVLLWYAYSPSGFTDFLKYRKGSGLQIESLFGAFKLLVGAPVSQASGAIVVDAGGWGWVDAVSSLVWLAIVVVVLVVAMKRGGEPIRLCGGLVTLSLLASHLLSPQYLVWLMPFVVVVWADGKWRLGVFSLAISLLTVAVIFAYGPLLSGSLFWQLALIVRNLSLLALGTWLLVLGLRYGARTPDSSQAMVVPAT